MARLTTLSDFLSRILERQPLENHTYSDRSLADLSESIISQEGEVSGIDISQAILSRYSSLSDDEKLEYFTILANDFGLDLDGLDKAVEGSKKDKSSYTMRRLMAAAEPRRQELLRRINRAPGATSKLVEMRADLIRLMGQNELLQTVDFDFYHLFQSWFNRGFLVLQKLDWGTSASILEKLIAYEAVHEIQGWNDLRQRVKPKDRCCYGYFHPVMPDDPLIFVEVALTNKTPSSIETLLTPDNTSVAPERTTTAVFYSISNCQKGLKGISFGNFLIKHVVDDLQQSLPNLQTFITLSPIPGLRKWVLENPDDDSLKYAKIIEDGAPHSKPNECLEWIVAHYLTKIKRPDGYPRDPVARFHLGNGARLEHIHSAANLSKRGQKQSYGAMVSYIYDLDAVDDNHESYANSQSVIISNKVNEHLKSRIQKERK